MHYPEPDLSLRLGSRVLSGHQIQCRVWAPGAAAVSLVCWQDSWTKSNQAKPDLELHCRYEEFSGCWVADVHPGRHAIRLPFFYQFAVERAGVVQSLFDPWAHAADVSDGSQSPRSCVLPSEFWHYAKTPVADGGWYRHPGQAVIYEAHVRDLTMAGDSPISPALRGGYVGVIGALDRIVALGASHLQLLPVQLFGRTHEMVRGFEDHQRAEANNYNWGYDPLSYFVPSAWYARDPADPFSRIRDLRLLIGEAHARGLRVILDVVYNHQYATGDFEHMAPGYWFRHNPDGGFCSNSGCGNDLESTRPLFRRLLAESLGHWIDQFDVDGFRFDLMGLCDSQTFSQVQEILFRKKTDLLLLGEGWQMYNGPAGTRGMDQKAVAETEGVAVFNDEFRDLCKGGGMNESFSGFLHGKAVNRHVLESNLIGQPRERYQTSYPWQNVQYVECHDGLTLHDNLAFNLKLDPSKADQEQELIRRCALGNFLLIMAKGICFVHAGQEFGRSKALGADAQGHDHLAGFVRNSYRSGDQVNALSWNLTPRQSWLLEWTKGLLELRRSHDLLRFKPEGAGKRQTHFYPQAAKNLLVWSIRDGDRSMLCVCNASRKNQLVKLPKTAADALAGGSEKGTMLVLADRDQCAKAGIAAPHGFESIDGSWTVAGLSAAIVDIEI